ncbi:MAG: phage portal protein [Rhodobacteraceae bacterium]|nr:MAG: phage portal protein [Paracoccaceae bacterium]
MSFLDRVLGRRQSELAQKLEPQISASTPVSGVTSPQSWLNNIGFGSQSNVKTLPRVTGVIAQKHATVFSCCNVIAGDLSKVPLKLYQRDSKGHEERVRDHPASYLLNVESSPGVPAIVSRYALAYAFCLRGRAYAYGPRDGAGELTLIDVVRQDGCTELRAGRSRFYEFEDGAGVYRRVPSRVMVHLRYMAEDGWTGRSPLEIAGESVGLALAGQEAAARTASGITTRAFLKMEDTFDSDEDYTRNAKRIRNALSDPDANGIPIIGSDDDIKSLDISAADQQLLQSRKFDREMIAGIYRVPPSKLQMLEYGVKANGEQQSIDYKADCLLHWGGFVEAQLMLGILTEEERRNGLFFKHDFNALLQSTTKERYEALNKAIGGPFMAPNEGRKIEGLEPVEGGDILNPAPNMTRDDEKPEGKKE